MKWTRQRCQVEPESTFAIECSEGTRPVKAMNDEARASGLDLGGDRCQLRAPDVERGEVVTVCGVGYWLLEALGAGPQIELVAPSLVPAWIATSLAQQEGLHAVL